MNALLTSLGLIGPEEILSATGLVTLLIAAWAGDKSARAISAIGCVALAVCFALTARAVCAGAGGPDTLAFGGQFAADAFAGFAKLLIYAASGAVLVIAPSRRIDDLAAEHQGSLPAPMRALLRGVGARGQGQAASGAALTSYLLFEPSFTQELINLGMSDTLARRADVQRFFGWPAAAPVADLTALRGRRGGFVESGI